MAKTKPARKSKAAAKIKKTTKPAKKTKPLPGEGKITAEAGVAIGEIDALRKQLDLTMDELTTRLGLTRDTLERRKLGGRLTIDESAKVIRFARVLGHALHTFGALDEARRWLKAPQRELGGKKPIDKAESEAGAAEVENLLIQRSATGVASR